MLVFVSIFLSACPYVFLSVLVFVSIFQFEYADVSLSRVLCFLNYCACICECIFACLLEDAILSASPEAHEIAKLGQINWPDLLQKDTISKRIA